MGWGTYSIRVVGAGDHGIADALVYVKYGFWSSPSCGYTDENGWVTLENVDDKFRPGFVVINHKDIGKVPARIGESYTIRI